MALISSLIVSIPVGVIVLIWRKTDSNAKPWSLPWLADVCAWVAAVASCVWFTYYVVLLSFEWGPAVSWEWLWSVALSFTISTFVTNMLFIVLMARDVAVQCTFKTLGLLVTLIDFTGPPRVSTPSTRPSRASMTGGGASEVNPRVVRVAAGGPCEV